MHVGEQRQECICKGEQHGFNVLGRVAGENHDLLAVLLAQTPPSFHQDEVELIWDLVSRNCSLFRLVHAKEVHLTVPVSRHI